MPVKWFVDPSCCPLVAASNTLPVCYCCESWWIFRRFFSKIQEKFVKQNNILRAEKQKARLGDLHLCQHLLPTIAFAWKTIMESKITTLLLVCCFLGWIGGNFYNEVAGFRGANGVKRDDEKVRENKELLEEQWTLLIHTCNSFLIDRDV